MFAFTQQQQFTSSTQPSFFGMMNNNPPSSSGGQSSSLFGNNNFGSNNPPTQHSNPFGGGGGGYNNINNNSGGGFATSMFQQQPASSFFGGGNFTAPSVAGAPASTFNPAPFSSSSSAPFSGNQPKRFQFPSSTTSTSTAAASSLNPNAAPFAKNRFGPATNNTTGPAAPAPTTKLYVSLHTPDPNYAKEEWLASYFSTFGRVVSVSLSKGRRNAFIEMDTVESAKRALECETHPSLSVKVDRTSSSSSTSIGIPPAAAAAGRPTTIAPSVIDQAKQHAVEAQKQLLAERIRELNERKQKKLEMKRSLAGTTTATATTATTKSSSSSQRPPLQTTTSRRKLGPRVVTPLPPLEEEGGGDHEENEEHEGEEEEEQQQQDEGEEEGEQELENEEELLTEDFQGEEEEAHQQDEEELLPTLTTASAMRSKKFAPSSSNRPWTTTPHLPSEPNYYEDEGLREQGFVVGVCEAFAPSAADLALLASQGIGEQSQGDESDILERPHSELSARRAVHQVKKFNRSSAGMKKDIPSIVRTEAALDATMKYLLEEILDIDMNGPDPRFRNARYPNGERVYESDVPPATYVINYVFNRTRGIRNDFTVQGFGQEGGMIPTPRSIRVFEECVRFHILTDYELLRYVEVERGVKENVVLNFKELNNALKTLMDLYSKGKEAGEVWFGGGAEGERKRADFFANEGEMTAYYLLIQFVTIPTHRPGTNDPKTLEKMLLVNTITSGLSSELRRSNADVGRALDTFEAFVGGDYVRWFEIFASEATPFLFTCLMHCQLAAMRAVALDLINNAHQKNQKMRRVVPLSTLSTLLRFDSREENVQFCEAMGLTVITEEEAVQFGDVKPLDLDEAAAPPRGPSRVVDAKGGIDENGVRKVPRRVFVGDATRGFVVDPVQLRKNEEKERERRRLERERAEEEAKRRRENAESAAREAEAVRRGKEEEERERKRVEMEQAQRARMEEERRIAREREEAERARREAEIAAEKARVEAEARAKREREEQERLERERKREREERERLAEEERRRLERLAEENRIREENERREREERRRREAEEAAARAKAMAIGRQEAELVASRARAIGDRIRLRKSWRLWGRASGVLGREVDMPLPFLELPLGGGVETFEHSLNSGEKENEEDEEKDSKPMVPDVMFTIDFERMRDFILSRLPPRISRFGFWKVVVVTVPEEEHEDDRAKANADLFCTMLSFTREDAGVVVVTKRVSPLSPEWVRETKGADAVVAFGDWRLVPRENKDDALPLGIPIWNITLSPSSYDDNDVEEKNTLTTRLSTWSLREDEIEAGLEFLLARAPKIPPIRAVPLAHRALEIFPAFPTLNRTNSSAILAAAARWIERGNEILKENERRTRAENELVRWPSRELFELHSNDPETSVPHPDWNVSIGKENNNNKFPTLPTRFSSAREFAAKIGMSEALFNDIQATARGGGEGGWLWRRLVASALYLVPVAPEEEVYHIISARDEDEEEGGKRSLLRDLEEDDTFFDPSEARAMERSLSRLARTAGDEGGVVEGGNVVVVASAVVPSSSSSSSSSTTSNNKRSRTSTTASESHHSKRRYQGDDEDSLSSIVMKEGIDEAQLEGLMLAASQVFVADVSVFTCHLCGFENHVLKSAERVCVLCGGSV